MAVPPMLHRIVQIADDIFFINFCIPMFSPRLFPFTINASRWRSLQLLEESPQSSCVVKILHQVFPGRSQALTLGWKLDQTFQVERNFRTSCQSCEVMIAFVEPPMAMSTMIAFS